MKYKLINTKTKEETICEKVTIDGFDYYVSEKSSNSDYLIQKDFYIDLEKNKVCQQNDSEFMKFMGHTLKRILATNNPNIDIPKVVDEVEKVGSLAIQNSKKFSNSSETDYTIGFIHGYNKSQETHPFSEEDMIEFVNWVAINYVPTTASKELKYWQKDTYQNKEYFYSTKELLQLWKEQKPKIVYYE